MGGEIFKNLQSGARAPTIRCQRIPIKEFKISLTLGPDIGH